MKMEDYFDFLSVLVRSHILWDFLCKKDVILGRHKSNIFCKIFLHSFSFFISAFDSAVEMFDESVPNFIHKLKINKGLHG